MADPPAVSILLTSYQQADFVVEALDSVLAQEWTDWELFVLDDGSTDGSAALIEAWAGARADPRVHLVLRERNIGFLASLNDGRTRCRGRWLAYLGADDRWAPGYLGAMVAALSDDPEALVAYCDVRHIDGDGRVEAESGFEACGEVPGPSGEVFEDLLRRNFVVASAAVSRRAAVEAVGGWDPGLPFEDWDLWLRLAERGRFVLVPGVLADYRRHDRSMSIRLFSVMLAGRMAVLEKWLGRQAAHDEIILPYLRRQSWRLFKVHPDRGRPHVATAYAADRSAVGRLRHLVATRPAAESAFEVLRRSTRGLRRAVRDRGLRVDRAAAYR